MEIHHYTTAAVAHPRSRLGIPGKRARQSLLSADLNLQIARLEIRDPLRTLLQPNIFFYVDEFLDAVVTCASFTVPHRDSGKPFEVTFTEGTPHGLVGDPAAQSHYLRELLCKMVTHEVDESIWSNGARIFEPHPEQKERT